MSRFITLLIFTLCTATTHAYHSDISETETADSSASCNAAFHDGCATDDHDEESHTASSSGSAAPVGVLGSSALEITLIVLLVGSIAWGRTGHRPVKRRRSSSQG